MIIPLQTKELHVLEVFLMKQKSNFNVKHQIKHNVSITNMKSKAKQIFFSFDC